MATTAKERFSSGTTGLPVPLDTPVQWKTLKDDLAIGAAAATDADGFASKDLQDGAVLLPGPNYSEITVGSITKQVHSEVYGVQGRVLVGHSAPYRLFTNGALDGVLNELVVTAPGAGLTTRVGTGAINLLGTIAPCGTLVTLTHSAAHASLTRIDRIVARLFLDAVDFGKVELAILTGTAAASPVAPALTQSESTIWEEMLCDVTLTAGLGTISAGNLTDRRSFAGPAIVGSVLQALLDLKAPLASPTFTGTVTTPNLTVTTGVSFPAGAIDAADIGGGNVSDTEFDFLNGVTSLIQPQINTLDAAVVGKAPINNPDFTGLVTLDARLKSTGTTPARTIDSNAGSGATCTVEGTDLAGTIELDVGTGAATGILLTITFATVKPDANYRVLLSPSSADARRRSLYTANKLTTGWQILVVDAAPLSSDNYVWDYAVFESEL